MRDPKKEPWQILCEQASVEQDPKKFLMLICELNEALKQREERLKGLHKSKKSTTSDESPDPKSD